jgi:hypothetical protein
MGEVLVEMGDRLLLLDELREEAEWNLDNFTFEWEHEEPEDRPQFLSLAGRAADEIERLREALETIAGCGDEGSSVIARAALHTEDPSGRTGRGEPK